MKRILLVIFFIAIIFSLIIYKITYKKTYNVLLLGEFNNIDKYNLPDNYNISTFIYDNTSYKELIKSIRYNDYIIIKEKKVYLNQLISKSDYIYVIANKEKYIDKCKKGKTTLRKYLDSIYDEKYELIKTIGKISHAKVIFVNYECGV